MSVVRSGRISASWAKEHSSSPSSRVHGAAHVRHARTDLGALVGVEQPAVPAHRFVEGDRDAHRCGRHREVRLAGADALVRAHRGGDPQMPGEVRDQRLGQIVASRDRVVVQPRVELRRPDLVGAVDVDTSTRRSSRPIIGISEKLASAGAATSGRGRWCRMTSAVGTSASTVRLRQRRPFWCTATTAVAVDRPFGDDVEDEFDRRANHDGTGEHRVRRPHRFVRESFGHSDNRLREHLGALHHLPLVLPGNAGVAGEPVGAVGLHVE